jgi:hypothetical protein
MFYPQKNRCLNRQPMPGCLWVDEMGGDRDIVEGNIVGAAGSVLAKLDPTDRIVAERLGLAERVNPGAVEPYFSLTSGVGDPNVNLEFVPDGSADTHGAGGTRAGYFIAITQFPGVADIDAENCSVVSSSQLQQVYGHILAKYFEPNAIVQFALRVA